MPKPTRLKLLSAICLVFLIFHCSSYKEVNREIVTPDNYKSLNLKSPYLKAHMKTGDVYILSQWRIIENERLVNGIGIKLNANRDTTEINNFVISIDTVSIFETNVVEESSAVGALTIITGISVAITAACITNPKACFGSCPTFYINNNGKWQLQAEGFSSSIAPPLEAIDIDALYMASPKNRNFQIEMRNEALETHVVRNADLLIVPKSDSDRVFKDRNNIFYQISKLIPPQSSYAPEGNINQLIEKLDGNERLSLADSINLDSKEFINIHFNNIPKGDYGLVIGARHSLLSTFLLYQAFSYMGNSVGSWFSKIDELRNYSSLLELDDLMGKIEIYYLNKTNEWEFIDNAGEYGPLATDIHFVPIQSKITNNDIKLRIKITKGNWRIDYLSLGKIDSQTMPKLIQPSMVWKNGKINHNSLLKICDSSKVITSYPGDIYKFDYKLPQNFDEYEYFLKSKGYYLEWIRKEWIEEENHAKLAELFMNTNIALQKLAPEFKKIEDSMEEAFWRSKYAKP